MGAVFTVPPGLPFLPTLAEALVAGELFPLPEGPLGLAEILVYLPTRRAARAFEAELARALGRPALLPRVVALGEAGTAELDVARLALDGEEALAPPIPPAERRLILTRLVQGWARVVDPALTGLGPDTPFQVPASPADAVSLAGDLEALMDALTIEGVPWTEIAGAVEADHSHYFRLTLDFVRIAAEHWPGILAERGAGDPATRSRTLVMAEADRLARERPATPVLVAGSMGSVPATAALATAAALLPRGALVLPGLDQDLDAEGWTALAAEDGRVHGHPQNLMHRLLDAIGLARGAVRALGAPAPAGRARARLLSEALRPAETTDRWARLDEGKRAALACAGLAGLAVVEALDEREEALAAALALRETLEVPGRTAMLVTPDRGLCARVAAELGRWGIVAEDAGGVPLTRSVSGQLARLAADVAASDAAPDRVLALLAHPWVRLGLDRAGLEQAAAALEIGALRGPAPGPGFEGLRRALATEVGSRRAPRPRRRLTEADRTAAADLVERLAAAFAGFEPPRDLEPVDLVALAGRHRAALDALTAPGPPEDDPAAAALDALFDDLALAESGGVPGRFDDYPAFFTAFAGESCVVAATPDAHPRLRLLGPVEARLVEADRVVLAGLDEGVWPPRAEGDAFLNRPMRGRIGLDPPERRIGLAAHDFVQGAANADAVVTRALKRGGSPTVPSRFLQRLKAFAGPEPWGACLLRGQAYRDFAAALDRGEPARRATRPAPRPDPALFPATLAVTEVETLLLDPYAIFARHVLGLDPLEPVATLPGASDRGTLVHAVLGGFAAECPGALPPDAELRLLQRAQDAYGPIADAYPELYAEWWPRFERLASEFLAWEARRRPDLVQVHAEVPGRWALPLPLPGRGVTLTARADRVERRRDGGLVLIDFKTGAVPTSKDVVAGLAPQLTLQAAMLGRGAFRGVPPGQGPPALLHVAVSGGREPLETKAIKGDLDALIEDHARRLVARIGRFLSGEAAYVSRLIPRRARGAAPYDHLARVREWSLVDEDA